MKAKFVYEAIGDVLKPKSEEEIMSSIDDMRPNTLLVKSAQNKFLLGIKKALETGADIHTGDDQSLRHASLYGHYDVVKFLLDNGADVHAGNDYALRLASLHGNYNVIKLLLNNGADVHANNDYALQYASANGHYDVVKLLKKWMEKDESY